MLKIKLLIGLFVFAGIAGAYAYAQFLRSENAVLTSNAVVKEAAIKVLQLEIQVRTKDSETKLAQLRKRAKQIAHLDQHRTELTSRLREVTRHDPKVVECLAVKPGVDFINELRQYTQGATGNEDSETVSRRIVLH